MIGSSKRRGTLREQSAISAKSRVRRAIQAAIEPLETRTLMSTTITYQVQGVSDVIADVNTPAGVNTFKSNTLRAAIDAANAQPFPVIIDLTKVSGTITLTSTAAHPNPGFVLGNIVSTTNGHTWKFVGNGKQTISGAGLYTIFNVGLASPTEFDSLTLSHGKAGNLGIPDLNFDGGAISAESSLTLVGDTFSSNTAEFGGAVAAVTGAFSATNCTFSGNTASDGGGAVAIDDVNLNVAPVFTGDSFIGNVTSGSGGAIYNEGNVNATFAVNNSTFTGNTAVDDGGAIYNFIETPGVSLAVTITGSKFTSNIASFDDGGAIFSRGSKLTVTGTTFTTNKATDDSGGAIYSEDDTLSVSTSTFTGDSADDSGGGIYFYGSNHSPTLIVTSSTFNNDTAVDDNGGGIAIGEEGDVDNKTPAFTTIGITSNITGSTFTGDSAYEEGGAVYSAGGPHSSLTVGSSVFTHNLTEQSDGGAIFTNDPTVTITGSTFTGNVAGTNGGALYSDAETLTVSTTSFTNNNSYNDGGGIYFDGDNATVSNSTFSGDFSEHEAGGGGIYSDAESLTVTGSTFTGDTAPNGGGIYSYDYNLDVDSTTFTKNTAEFNGGGIDFAGVSATVTNSTFTSNTAAAGDGGGIFVGGEEDDAGAKPAASPDQPDFEPITLSVATSTFTSNSAQFSGGGIYFEDFEEIPEVAKPAVIGIGDESGLFISQSTFTNNIATTGGGGVYAFGFDEDDEFDVFDSTFNGNTTTSDGGGGIYSDFISAQFANDTFFNNGAGSDEGGGGLYITFPFQQFTANAAVNGGDDVTVTDSTFDANYAGYDLGGGIGMGIVEFGGVLLDGNIIATNYVTGTPATNNDLEGNYDPASTNNIIGDLGDAGVVTGFTVGSAGGNFVGTNLSPINPMLAPLADNGGPTQTQALLPGSLAIGNNSDFQVFDINDQDVTATDQRGVDRPQKQGYDIGAFQSIPGLDDHFVWITPSTAIKGQPFSVTVEALTDLNVVDNTFDETVTITSSDAAATGLPGPGTLVFNNGVASFMPTLNTVGSQTFTITDTTTGTNTPPATSNPIVVSAPVVPVTPTINISNATAAAPTSGSGTVNMVFTVTLSAASASTVTVTYGTMQGTASSGHGDYVGIPSGTLTFSPGQTSKTISIQIKKATFPASTYAPPYTPSHPGVYFYVLLTNANNAILGSATGIGTITY